MGITTNFTAEFWTLLSGVSGLNEIDFDAPPAATASVALLDTFTTTGSFWDGGQDDDFAARYTSDLRVTEAGTYTFYLTSDDGSSLSINGAPVIDNDGLHAAREQTVTVNLAAGTYPIEVRYFEAFGAATLALDWSGPDTDGLRQTLTRDAGSDDTGTDDTGSTDENLELYVNGVLSELSSYGNAEDAGKATVSSNDHRVILSNNAWKSIAIDATITEDTYLIFDYQSSAEGEVHAIGFDRNNAVSPDWLFQLDGTETYGLQDENGKYTTGSGYQTYAIKVGDYFQGDFNRLVLAMDDDADVGGNSAFRNITIADAVEVNVNGVASAVFSYGGDQDEGNAAISDNDSRVRLTDNAWKAIAIDETITEDTYLNFEFRSDAEGEIHGIGFDQNDALSPKWIFQLDGTGTYGLQGENGQYTTGDGYQSYSIKVGDYFQGDFSRLVLAMDDDADAGANSFFRNITIEERPGDTDGGNGGDTGVDPGGDDIGPAASIPGYDGPIPPVTSAQIEAFVTAVRAEGEGMAHMGMENMAAEHMAAMNLAPRDEASHIAIANGDWDDPDIWYNGQVPGEDATVLIPDGIMVNYDHVSDVSLFTVRVDGMLRFATNVDTRMEVDTIVVSPEGYLQMGTEDNPIQPNVTADIVFADNGNIDTNWDPMLLSRGLLSHGAVDIYGAEKTAFLDLAEDPMAGDTTLQLTSLPEGWQVGDKLVLTGTHLTGWYWDNDVRDVIHHESEDEELVITAINGTTITFDRPLEFDHDAPRDDLSAYVANMSRNVTFSSEGGDDLPVHQRGHVMFMHSDDVDVRYAGFVDLGRTDKSEDAFDVSTLSSVDYDTNIKARYSFHFHETGTLDQENPAIAIGNVVDGNPGWGYVHHGAHAEFTDNIAYDVFGAGFAAEDGDETGIWLRNMAIDIQGIGPGDYTVKDAGDAARHDNGRTGDGFFFAGRLVEAAENIAANATNGFVWFHRSAPDGPQTENLDQPEIGYGNDTMRPDAAPIHGFRDNEAFATNTGLIVIKATPAQNHDIRSVFDGFTNWETREGVNISYTAHYTLIDFDLTAVRELNPFQDTWPGLTFGTNTYDMVINGITMDGFETGIDMTHNVIPDNGQPGTNFNNFLIDGQFINVDTNLEELYNGQLQQMTSSQLVDGRLEFDLQTDTLLSVGDTLSLSGIKTDSIGTTDRQVATDPHQIEDWYDIARLIADQGYYTGADGQPIVLIEDYVADRATGELLKINHAFTLDLTVSQVENEYLINQVFGGAEYHGALNLGGPAPVAEADSFVFAPTDNQDLYIDVLANDYDPDGGAIRLDGLVDPVHGDVFQQDDGTLMYRPDRGYTGTDTFDYWLADEEGNFSKGTVTIEVSDSLM
ncbi:MAG: PA14 domain-containing protein [Sedimentitalea sp.]|uniref:PA14 domain-containing protein n=1 Tax=Sedimentitalea sp. TaxID=2048915 RepID=UPI0032652C08